MSERHLFSHARHGLPRHALLAVLPLVAATSVAAQAAAPRDRMLVTTSWLGEHLQDPDLVLLHVGEKAEYDAGHIAGARYISLRDIDGSAQGEMPLELPAPADLRARLERFGISDDTRIVVYYGNDWVSPATRVLYTLDYAGLGDRTVLLDGGMGAWQRDARPVTADVPVPGMGSLSASVPKDIVVDADWVQSNLRRPGVAIIDARDAAFYDGVRPGHEEVKGHIVGAVSIPFTSVFDDELRLRPAAELEAMFAEAGIEKGDTVVVYCHIGQQATAVVFAARTLGFTPKLYDGSFHDWGMRGLPVELPRRDERP